MKQLFKITLYLLHCSLTCMETFTLASSKMIETLVEGPYRALIYKSTKEGQEKILGLKEDPREIEKNKKSYEQLEIFSKNPTSSIPYENLSIGLSRIPLSIQYIHFLLGQNETGSSYDQAITGIKLLHNHATSSLLALEAITNYTLNGQKELKNEISNKRNEEHLNKSHTLIELFDLLIKNLNIISKKIDTQKPLQPYDDQIVNDLIKNLTALQVQAKE